jgi:quercetin dioxygenase-like cupin family protein
MSTSDPVSTHPMKVTVANTSSDETLESADGWMDMDVKWLVTSDSVGAKSSVFGITVFPPGAKHDIHRHPNAEEIEYLISGSGVAQVGDADVLLEAGELVFVPRNDYHGFHNTSSTETAVMVWTYAPAASLAEAGYVRKVDDKRG